MLLINILKVSKNIKTINIKNILRNGEIQLGTLTIYSMYIICFESSMYTVQYITKMRQIQEVLNLQLECTNISRTLPTVRSFLEEN